MCGIVGILNFDPRTRVDVLRLKRMRDVLRHRGPDDEGLMLSGPIGLGHRRLSIIDTAGGHQPMASFDRHLWITYNGEVYNYRELRADLALRGHRFETQSDTEVVLRAYEAYGEDCVARLRGMFAFAIWDARQHKLFLARDRLGIKPLYYAVVNGELVFASEIKAILAAGIGRPSFNRNVLPEFLATRFSAGTDTFFEGIRKLLPGRTLSWSLQDGFCGRRYWRPPIQCREPVESFAEAASELRERLDEAVEGHMVSDVPLGLFLSGGVDSSGLAALMASKRQDPLHTFSVGFEDRQFSELDYARRVADVVGARHRDVTVSPVEFFRALPSLIWHEDEPIAFPSSVSLYFVSELARRNGIKVVLSGEGADELFLGYNRYRVTAWNERIGRYYWSGVPNFVRHGIRRLSCALPGSLGRYSARSFLARGPDPRDLFFDNFATFPMMMRRALLRDSDALRVRDPYQIELQYYHENAAGTLERMAHSDLQTYLVELLMKQDQMSMAASVESRVPFLDHQFVEYALGLPGHYKLRGWRTKAVLRAALRDLIPREVLIRRKMGFPTPIGRWLRGAFRPWLQEFLLQPRCQERELYHPIVLHRLVAEHVRGVRDHGERLWCLINLEIWQRIFIEGQTPAEVLNSLAPRRALDAVA